MNPKAACVLIFNEENKVLAVSRRGEHTQFGLPGGKVDDGETTLQAAVRELQEETGIVLYDDDDLEFLYADDDGHGYDVTTFILTRSLRYHEASQQESDMVVEWVEPRVLISGPFGQYNLHVFEANRMRMSQGYD